MHYLQLIFQEFQSSDHCAADSGEHWLADPGALQFIQRACIHVLHAIIHATFDKECTIEFDDFWCDCAM
jgi:hypothetical protein